MKIIYAVEFSIDEYSDSFTICVFETKEMANEYIEKYKQKYFFEYGEEESCGMWVSELEMMESVDEALWETEKW